ncbi:MAG: 3-oxo-5-alpha-steroid 4-dehydrogenase, partial [Woeseia sp.]
MNELQIHSFLVLTTIGLAGVTFMVLLSINAPYGRHLRPGWGPTMPARIGWIVMESPAVLLFAAVYAIGVHAMSIAALALFVLWQFHYLNRGFIFPFRMREAGRRMPVAIAGTAFAFNCLNAYINARWISHFGHYPDAWLASGSFAVGLILFLAGWAINQQADAVLIRLRQPGESGYRIPHGGLYRWVSCPNYLGEMLQ